MILATWEAEEGESLKARIWGQLGEKWEASSQKKGQGEKGGRINDIRIHKHDEWKVNGDIESTNLCYPEILKNKKSF